MRKDYELIGKAVRFTPTYDEWYSGIPETIVESYRGTMGIIESVRKDDVGNTAVAVRWNTPTHGMGRYFRTGFGASENCSCQDCESQRHPDLELLIDSI
jgi:hypothetical protein